MRMLRWWETVAAGWMDGWINGADKADEDGGGARWLVS